MTQQPLPSDKALKAAQVLSRLEDERSTRHMARVFFWVLIVLFVLNSLFLLYSAFSNRAVSIVGAVSTAFDGLLGILLGIVARNLFPARCKDKDGNVKEIGNSKRR